MRLDAALTRFRLSEPERIGHTATSTVWKVRQAEGGAAVLKPQMRSAIRKAWASVCSTPPASAHCALSTRWSPEAELDITENLRLLPFLLAAQKAE